MQDFIGDASHELRTPLTVIKGYVELLSQTQTQKNESQTKAFLRLDSEIKRMEALIKDLLLITELNDSSGLSLQQIHLTQMINQSLDDLKVLQPERSIEVQVQTNMYINGDLSLLSQLLANIFSNIARHTPTDARIKVTLNRVMHQVVLRVEDAGPGLPPQFYSEGIQHFQRFDKSRSRESGGSGLGMSIMRAIVEKHGGSIELGPSALGGLSITVTLPGLSLS
jgi:signal transduction histidine kinase